MEAMFRGHSDIGGGISGAAGVGNLGSTFQTSYQRNYGSVPEYQRKIEAEQSRRLLERAEEMEKLRVAQMVREMSPPRNETAESGAKTWSYPHQAMG